MIVLLIFCLLFTVHGGSSHDVGPTEMPTVELNGTGSYTPELSVFEDGRKPGLVVNPETINPFAEGTSESFTVKLSEAPSGNVTVTLSVRTNSHVPVTIKPASLTLTFSSTDWNTAQTVTVTHTEDNIEQKDGWVTVDLAAAGGGADGSIGQVNLLFTDNDAVATPSAPTGLGAVASGQTQIDLSWTAPSNIGGAAITGYRIEVSSNAGTSWTNLEANTGSTATTYAHTGLAPSTTRHYRVSAINSGGISPASNVASATTGAGLVVNPEIISPFAEGTSESFTVKLSEAPSGNVTVTLSVRTNSHVPVTIKPASLTLTFSSTDWNTAQTVTVTHTEDNIEQKDGWVTVDLAAAGGGADGSIGQVNLLFTDNDAVATPSAPTGLGAVASGQTQIDLSWTAPSNIGGAAITGYRIEVSSNAGTSWTDLEANTGSTATTYAHTGLAPSTTRHYRVSAINSGGISPASNVASATTGAGLVVNPEIISPFAEGTSESFTVKLSEAPSGNVTVTLSVRTNSHVPVTIKPASLTLTFSSTDWNTAQTVTVTHTEDNIEQKDGWVTVDLAAAGGGADGSIGQVDLYFTDNDAVPTPSAPTGLGATASGATQIDLSWTAPSNTGGAAITGYRIEVSSNAGTSWTDLIGNTTSTATTYAHTGLAPGTTRHYRVSAINSVGTGPASNVASATTGAGLVVNPKIINPFAEGTSESFTVKLSEAPSGNVTVTLSERTDSHVPVTIKPASLTLTFSSTDWNTAQTVTVTHTDNSTVDGDGWVIVELTAAGGGADGSKGQVDLYFTDNDKIGLVVSATTINPFAEGTSESFTVKLSEAPSGNVTVTLSVRTNSYVPVTIKPASLTLTFSSTDWNTAQTVTVTHTEDNIEQKDGWVIVDLAAAGGGADGSIGSDGSSGSDGSGGSGIGANPD